MTTPTFSVVVPLYNKERHVRRSIDSVLAQTFTDWELIVVDDGSTDSGPEIVQSYSDLRIRLIHQDNSGVSAARNRGIAAARGPWITFLDSDDEWLPDFLGKVNAVAVELPELGAIYGIAAYMRGGAKLNAAPQALTAPSVVNYQNFITHQGGEEMHSSCVAIKRQVFTAAGMFPVGVRIGEDSDLWFRVGWSAKVAHIPEVLSIYHMDAGDSHWQRSTLVPPWVGTYKAWLKEGKIPECARRPAAVYYQRHVAAQSIALARQGRRFSALVNLFTHLSVIAMPCKSLCAVMANICLPSPLMKTLRGRREMLRPG